LPVDVCSDDRSFILIALSTLKSAPGELSSWPYKIGVFGRDVRLAHASEWIQDKASWFMSVVPRKKRLGRRKTFRVKTMRLRQASDRLERTGRLATPRPQFSSASPLKMRGTSHHTRAD